MTHSVPIATVTVLGAGVIGTSVGLALRRRGLDVRLSDPNALAVAAAVRAGAGAGLASADPPADVVVIATPPSTVAEVLGDAMSRDLGVVYTDVAGVKASIIASAECDLSRYVPGHPVVAGDLADRAVADADLFAGRHWYLCPLPENSASSVEAVRSLVHLCGGLDRERTPDVHDRHMAAVAHLPRLLAAAAGAQFDDLDEDLFPVNGSRFHSTMSVPGVAPELWADTIEQNSEHVADALDKIIRDLAGVSRALRDGRAVDELTRLLTAGKRGHDRVVEHACKISPLGNGIPAPEEEWFWVR